MFKIIGFSLQIENFGVNHIYPDGELQVFIIQPVPPEKSL
jgi:hypothetical protein